MHIRRIATICFLGLGVMIAAAQDKLPSNVAFRLKEADRILARAERALESNSVASEEWKVETAKAAAEEARGKMAEIEQRYAGQYSPAHPDIVAMQDRIAKLEAAAGGRADAMQQAQAAEEQQAAEAGAASVPWLARLRPYVIGLGQAGYDPDKYLVPSATQDQADMRKRLGIYGEAAAALEEYKKANLGALATDELKQAAAMLDNALVQFQSSCRQYADQDLRDADAAIGHLEQFIREQDTRMAAKEAFLFPERDLIGNAQSIVDRAAGLMKTGDQRINALNRRIEGLKRADARLRAARVAETRMAPDAYAGGDAAALKKSAEQFVLRAQPGARVLKTAIISPDWKQESVLEWTDTTQTALRHRTTRSLAAQVAGKRNADTLLYTVDVSQDLQAGGGWGPTYGHVMFTDPILEANVQ
ncbi:MAG: hypothetical protein KA248_04610 [Kiritimatiellae bacterium]|nr:hypothetical protein [Kiritimatiellia bacterium]